MMSLSPLQHSSSPGEPPAAQQSHLDCVLRGGRGGSCLLSILAYFYACLQVGKMVVLYLVNQMLP